jgi:hypothetical protein
MAKRSAATRRFVFILPALVVAGATTAWAQAGATGSSSGSSGPANQSPGPTVPAPTGTGGAADTGGPSVPGPADSGNASGAPNVPGLDQTQTRGSPTTRGGASGNPSCTTAAPNAADCGGPAPPR